MKDLRGYIRIARVDHWIKQLFILPGMVFAVFMISGIQIPTVLGSMIKAFLSTCFVASANYVINEWLDAQFDKYHPTKKNRPVVAGNLKAGWIVIEYILLAVIGLVIGAFTSKLVFAMELWLLIMGILYNVRPIRTKEIPYVDVLSESINNAIRLLMAGLP